MHNKLKKQWIMLSRFVYNVCKNRDKSHGYYHMRTVAEKSLEIYNEIYDIHNLILAEYIMTVAWLHDVADHKYEIDNMYLAKVNRFLLEIYDQKTTIFLINIIDRISYSKEYSKVENNLELDWKNILNEDGLFIRNIVSDADKLEALGKNGLDRCILYGQIKYKKNHGIDISKNELKEEVKCQSIRVLKIKDHYLRTEYGKQLAELLHDDYIKYLHIFLNS